MNRKEAIVATLSIMVGLIFLRWTIKMFFNLRRRGTKGLEDFREYIIQIAELIIPRTDTPGATDAKVSDYIIKILNNCHLRRDQVIFITGLERLERYSYKHFNTSFLDCSLQSKRNTLRYFEKESTIQNSFLRKVKLKLVGPSFFELMKRLTVKGYCTSMVGATKGLAYDSVPGKYVPCDHQPNQKSWALK